VDDLYDRLHSALSWVARAKDPAVTQLPVDSLVTIGQMLWDISARARLSLKPIKDRLREEALSQAGEGSGTFKYWALRRQGFCQVVVPPPRAALRERVTLDDLQRMLGDTFGTYFTVNVQPRADFLEQADKAPQATREALMEVVNLDTDKPRVTFEDRTRS